MPDTTTDRAPDLLARFRSVREATAALAVPLSAEDMQVQVAPEASPTKWHLAHTTWFFERFVLVPHHAGYRVCNPRFDFLWNSYYEAVGERQPRPRRGILTRPSLDEVRAYRAYVDAGVAAFLATDRVPAAAAELLELGLHHEQQHQELVCTDLKLLFGDNPLAPVYRADARPQHRAAPALRWRQHGEGLVEVGHRGPGFAFDNEGPRHRTFVPAFTFASRLVTNGEYLEFVRDGGYRTPSLWLSDGWAAVQTRGWQAPMYWRPRDGGFVLFTLGGERELDPHEPVCHVSHYEADAYARWAGARLPTEFEWEHAVPEPEPDPVRGGGSFLDAGTFHPAAAPGRDPVEQAYGEVWQWTASAYTAYPGFRAAPGAVGEYNGKFMSGQMVLRGASCFTPRSHARRTYRNFFHADTRWQMAGIRLAKDA